jgi:hypothetical protein
VKSHLWALTTREFARSGAGEGPAELLADRRGACVSCVNVEPRPGLLAEIRELGDRIHSCARGGPDGGHDRSRVLDFGSHGVRAQTELLVDGKLAKGQADQASCLLDREVRLLGGEDYPTGTKLASRGERTDHRDRRGVLDVAVQALREAQKLAEPIDREELHLRGGGRGAPEHRVHVQGRREKLGEDSRLRAGVREVGEESRMIPVGDPRQDGLVEVAQDSRERLTPLGR